MVPAEPRSYRSSRAFLVRSADMGEADRRLTFFAEAEGVMTAVAKFARRSRKRFPGGSLQKYFLLDIAWTEGAGRMGILTHSSVVESFFCIVDDWEKVRYADYLLELAANLFPQPGPKPRAFAVLHACFQALHNGEAPASGGTKAEAAFLSIAGWGPDLSRCRSCGRAGNEPYRFVARTGGLLCGDCAGREGILLSPGSVRTWRAIQTSEPSALRRLRIPYNILKELQAVLPGYLEWNLGRPLRSLGGGAQGRKSEIP
jgi:DNA repair protein RecO (recombination protein O)